MTATLSQDVDLQVEHAPAGAAPAGGAPVDGRTLRAQRTRDAVVEALLSLNEDGDLMPTAQRVAARAGVALRTVYGHFSDMEALWLEAGRREMHKIGQLADVPPADLPLPERTARFCASRARVLEALLPVMRATRLRLPSSSQLRANWAWYVDVGDREVEEVFAREVAPLTEDDARVLLDGLYLVSSASAWDALRGDRRLDPEAARAVLERSVTALLSPYALPEGPA